MRPLSKQDIKNEMLIYRFKNIIRIGKKAHKNFVKENNEMTYRLSITGANAVKSELILKNRKPVEELMIIMMDILDPNSEIHYDELIDYVIHNSKGSNYLLAFVINNFNIQLNQIQAGNVRLSINSNNVNLNSAYLFIVNKILNANDMEARKREIELNQNPIGFLIWQKVYEFTIDILFLLDELIEELGNNGLLPSNPKRGNLCIFCKSKEGKFTTREHTLPESLGNYMSILPRGWCCNNCNSKFSKFEEKFLKMNPFLLMKVFATNYTKSGKFPSAEYENLHLDKIRPNFIRITNHAGKSGKLKDIKKIGENTKFRFPPLSKKSDFRLIARVLIKAALGCIALERGRDYVLQEKFDTTRNYIQEMEPFMGRLIIPRTFKELHRGIMVEFEPNGSFVRFNIQGLYIVVSLFSNILPPLPQEIKEQNLVVELIKTNEDAPNTIEIDKLMEIYDEIIRHSPKSHEAWFLKGKLYHQKFEDFEKAEEAYKRSITVKNDFPQANYWLGELYIQIREFKKAKPYLEKVLELDHSSWKAWNSLGIIYRNRQEYKKAENAYKNALEINSEDILTFNNLGLLYLSWEKYTSALSTFGQSINIKPNFKAFLNKGVTYFQMQDYEKAKTYFEKAKNYNQSFNLSFNLAVVNLRLKNNNEAKDYFQKALKLNPGDIPSMNHLSSILIKERSLVEAKELIDRIFEIDPNNLDAKYNLACCYSIEMRTNDAINLLREIIDQDEKYKLMAKDDDDFVNLKDNPTFNKLVDQLR